jgi:anhydro-N-acetylmuramic acid kinase
MLPVFATTGISRESFVTGSVMPRAGAPEESLQREGPIVVVNIGGVANITYIDGADTLIACDTGPGNALLDDHMFRHLNQPFDKGGSFAALGKIDEAWIAELPFQSRPL